jgi:hypothetical protein
MHNPAEATVSAPPRLIESEADAQTAIVQLTEVMDGLQALVEQETALVRAGELRQATGLEPKKAELAGHYFKAAERLKANASFLSRAVPEGVGALEHRHDQLQAVLKTNLIVLATAHAVSEGIVRRLSGELARKAAPQVYGASGRTTGPDPKRSQPLALSRML